jgi:carbonic anhydrase
VEIVRVETEKQLDAVRELWLAYYHLILERYGVDMGYDYFRAEMAALPGLYAPPAGRLFLAQDDETPAGCVGLRRVTAKKGELKRLYVGSGYRGRGLGRALVRAALEAAREIGYQLVQVHTAPFLTEAVGLYRALGFQEVPTEEEEAERFMELALT